MRWVLGGSFRWSLLAIVGLEDVDCARKIESKRVFLKLKADGRLPKGNMLWVEKNAKAKKQSSSTLHLL